MHHDIGHAQAPEIRPAMAHQQSAVAFLAGLALAAVIVLVFLLTISLLGTGAANTEAEAAKAALVKQELVILALLNERPVIDRETGAAYVARIESYGGEK